MGKKFSGVSQTMSRFRGWIQAGATLLTNLHLPNFLKGGLYQGDGEDRLRAGAELLLLPGGLRSLSHRGVSGGGGVFQVQLLLLYHRLSHSAGSPAGTLYLRLSVSLRLVSGAAAQDPDEEALHKEAEAADIPQVRRPAGDGFPAAGVPCERCRHGRPVLLQIPLPPGRAGGGHPAVPCQFRHPGGAGQACLHGNSASCCR